MRNFIRFDLITGDHAWIDVDQVKAVTPGLTPFAAKLWLGGPAETFEVAMTMSDAMRAINPPTLFERRAAAG